MAVSLRRVANGYPDVSGIPDYNAKPVLPARGASSKRILKKEIESKAEYRRSVLVIFSGMFIVLFMMGMSYIFVKAGITQMNWEINQISNENQSIIMENERIKGIIASKKSLDRIEAIATKELGMVREAGVEYMVLSNTVVSEGKIKPVETEAPQEDEKPSPVASIINFFLAWKK
jgi:cell division protein FtsL